METWDIYDIHRIPKGCAHVRGTKINKGDYRLVVHVAIFNTKGQMLIQQRQPFKTGWSNLWDVTVGGSVTAGETSQTGVHRELLEELGCDIDFTNVRPQVTFNFEHGFDDWYILEKDIDIKDLHLQYIEVQAVRWADLEEIYQLIEQKLFIPYHREIFPVLYAMRTSSGAHQYKEK